MPKVKRPVAPKVADAKPEPAKPEPAKPEPKSIASAAGTTPPPTAGKTDVPVPTVKPPEKVVEAPKPEPAKPEPPKDMAATTGAKEPVVPRAGAHALPAGNFDATAAQAFKEIALATKGGVWGAATAWAMGERVGQVMALVKDIPDLDVVFVIDTTSSMDDDMRVLKSKAGGILATSFARSGKTRAAVVLFRDKGDEYVTRVLQSFTDDKGAVQGALGRIGVAGGGDTPEHVYAGLMTALNMSWRPEANKLIVLIGDAAPHDDYEIRRGSVTSKARSLGVVIYSIIVAK
jgi:Mg-chelatase subunit ChlD